VVRVLGAVNLRLLVIAELSLGRLFQQNAGVRYGLVGQIAY
jgi:hypothetical protein